MGNKTNIVPSSKQTVVVEDELLKDVRRKMIDDGLSFQKLVPQLLEAYVGKGIDSPALSKKEQEYLDAVLRVLRGDKKENAIRLGQDLLTTIRKEFK